MPDRDLDMLYQLPLGEFTEARNALAKTAGKHGAAIKALEKPSSAAWAVNQLYWKDRRAWDQLIRASERVRAAHAQVLKGKKVDLRLLELQHSAAVRDAAERIRASLNRAGDPGTPATMKSVADTLQALPGGGEPGRLTKALAPIGFGAFGVLIKGAVSSKALADVVTFAPPKPKPDEIAEAAKRAEGIAKARRRELEVRSRKLAADLSAARAKFDRAEAARVVAEANLQRVTADASRHRSEVSRLEQAVRVSERERQNLG